MEPYVEELARISPYYMSAYPNAVLPDPLSPTGFPETAETFRTQGREVGTERLAQRGRRLLRHNAGSHSRDGRS